MHLVGPYLTTTNYNNKKKTSKSKKLAQAKTDHESWLKSVGVGKTKPQLDKKGRRLGLYDAPNLREGLTVTVKTSDKIGNGSAKEANVYTGTLIKGVATMHKSNAVPIISKEQAIEVSTMRRN